MDGKDHDLGYLKRRDTGDGKSELVDGFGIVVATVETALIAPTCRNLEVRRFRVTPTD